MLPVVVHASEDHYKRWRESEKTDLKSYGIGEADIPKLPLADNQKFKNPQTGYFKRSSATANIPIAYKRARRWPNKFYALLESLQKYPHEKHFVWSRHTAQGANAVGEFLTEQGWARQSYNRMDHGANPPADNSRLGQERTAIAMSHAPPAEVAARTKALFAKATRRPYHGFVVLNKDTSQREVSNSRELFNDPLNVDGRIVRVFVGDEKFSEGVSLFAVNHVHLLDTPPEYQGFRQVVARAVRLCSHEALPWPWTVRVHQYVANMDDQHPMTDDMLQHYQHDSAALLQQVIDAARDSALETGLPTQGAAPARATLWRRILSVFSRRAQPTRS